MDLLKGYGSDDSTSSSSSSSSNQHEKTKPIAEVPSTTTKTQELATSKSTKKKRGDKRILSLAAVLPPEIFAKLTRPQEEDDSSTSSYDEDRTAAVGDSQPSKKRKRGVPNIKERPDKSSSGTSGGGDRTELNSLLSELRSTPMHDEIGKKKETSKTLAGSKKKEEEGLGMAFMSYSTTTTTKTKKMSTDVVNIHDTGNNKKQTPPPPQPIKQKQVSNEDVKSKISKPTQPKATVPSFSRMSTAAPVVAAASTSSSFTCNVAPQYAQMPEYPVDMNQNVEQKAAPPSQPPYNNNNNMNMPKSRKQRREEERALRSGIVGEAFSNSTSATTTDIQQPSPTEFAPTAHAAAVASRAARYRGASGGGGGGVSNIAMYDPQSGTDVKGLGVTGKHRSKHQINQLMASAISLEAHRASEAELARLGGTGSGAKSNRADAKRKYGW